MAPRLKVYATRIGFHDVVVAAPSQKAALAAWDVREDLFGRGAAQVVDDDTPARESALAQPGVVLSRAIGEAGDFHAQAKTPARAPKAAARPKPPKTPKASKAEPARPAPDRSALTVAEAALAALDREVRQTQAEFARERRALDAREAGAIRRLEGRRPALERERTRLERVYTRNTGK